MKYRLLIPSTLIIMALAGCQQANAPEIQTSSEEEGGKLLVDQVMSDGSSERVMEIDLDKTKPVDISILQNTKGMVLDQDGFSPTELTIKPGVKVIFESRGEEDHWPIADDTIETTACSDLDAGKALQPGENYEYVFQNPGECTVQDNNNKDAKAVITVVAE